MQDSQLFYELIRDQIVKIRTRLTDDQCESLRALLTVEGEKGLELPAPGLIRFDGKQKSLQPRCWIVLNHVVQNGPASVYEIETLLSNTEDEEVELDNKAVDNIVSITNRTLRSLKTKETLSGRGGSFTLQKSYKK